MSIKIQTLMVVSDAVFDDFSEYTSDENIEVHKLLRERKYTVKDTGVTYRVINHWHQMGVLPESFNDIKNGWRKFSFAEIVWLEIVNRLRQFGSSLEMISKVRDKTMSWDKKDDGYWWLEYYIVKTRISEMDAYVAVSLDGDASVIFSRDIEMNKILLGSRSLILISIKDILESFGLKVKKPESLIALNETEKEILFTLRNTDFNSLSVKKQNGKIESLDISKLILNSDGKSIREQIKESGDFAEVITKFEEGRERSATVIKKKKF